MDTDPSDDDEMPSIPIIENGLRRHEVRRFLKTKFLNILRMIQ